MRWPSESCGGGDDVRNVVEFGVGRGLDQPLVFAAHFASSPQSAAIRLALAAGKSSTS
jgi:hypothetical protein